MIAHLDTTPSPSAYYQRASGERCERAVDDERLLDGIREIHAANYYAYGYRRMWKALLRAGETDVGRDRVKRLMRSHDIQGAKRRGKLWRTTTPDPAATRSPDLIGRDFTASRPDALWCADFTCLRCWEGLVFFSLVIDAYSRRIVGWQFGAHMRTDLVLDVLRMADRVWRTRTQLELAIVEWVAWFNTTGLHQALGDRPPAEVEALYATRYVPTPSLNQ